MRIGVVQMRAVLDKEANFTLAKKLVTQAVVQYKAGFVCLPENFDYIGAEGEPELLSLASDGLPTSNTLRRYQGLARELRVWLSLGGMHERLVPPHVQADGTTRAGSNTHIVLDSSGSIRAKYRKIHLFDANVDGGWTESKGTAPGDELIVVKDTPIGNVGLSTCFDVRFPEQYLALTQAGAQVILVPSAFMPTTGSAHWHTLLRARAIENQVFVAAAAQWGEHSSKRSSYGHSLIVGPWGEVLADLGKSGDGVAVVQLDTEAINNAKKRIDLATSRARATFAMRKPVSVL